MSTPESTDIYEDWSERVEKKLVDSLQNVGVSNLTILHTTLSRHQRQSTESTMSSSPVAEDIIGSRSAGSAPPSPVAAAGGTKHSNPSPISKPPSLTLTPNSSDTAAFLGASPFNGTAASSEHSSGPTMPYLVKHHRRGTSSNFGSTGSFDLPPEPSSVDQSPRHRSRDRPPLSQSYLEMHNSTTTAAAALQMMDQQQHVFGAIGSDARRRRASSHDTVPLPPPPDHFKFGGNPTNNPPTQPQQQSGGGGGGGGGGFAGMDRPRHMRSVSQPGPPGLYGTVEPHAGSHSGHYRPAAVRSSSFYETPPPPPTSRSASSSPNLGQYYGASYPLLDRRDALDFYPAASYSGSIDSFTSHTAGGGSVSPVAGHHSPHTVHYGVHPMRYPSHEHDELVGENIEVPDQHEDLPYYGGLQTLRGHGHSLSLDAAATYGAAVLPRQKIYAVKFKRSQRNFVLGSRVNRELKIGTYVKVEADRGEDLGIVVGRPDKSYIRDGPKRILRLATHDEVSLLGLKREEEEELLNVCRQKALQRGLPMNVVDAEYQFDRHKLTFFFEAEGRVDFRELVRDLFSMYKTRIWMQQLDKSTSMFAPAMVAPVMDGPLDFGNPIIAPLSEFVDSIYPNVQP